MNAPRRDAGTMAAGRHALALLLFLAARGHAAKKAAKAADVADELLYLTDSTLEEALNGHRLLLISVNVPGCVECVQLEKKLRQAAPELRVKAKSAVKLGQLRIESQDSPVLAKIVQGQLSLPKLIVFKEGEALDYNGEFTKASIIETMLREASRDTVQTLRTVKQAERFLHLDSWSSQHADEEKPPRVVGFFPSNQSKGYGVFRDAARKLQGLITFGECFDAAMQKKFLGAPTRRAVIQLVKADKRERKLTYTGPLAQPPLSRWVATHSVALVQDLSTESSIEALMAIGVPVFLLLMPDSYEEELAELIASFRAVASRVRERLLFGYGFKDTEPWPQFAQQLGIAPSATGAYWMIVGNGMDVTGRDWSTAWLRPPSLGFQIYAMDARGKETAEDVTEAKIQSFVDMFHGQLLKLGEPPWMTQWEAVAEEDEEVADAPVDSADGAGSSAGEVAAREYDKTLRKLIGNVQMNFNSGVAQLKKALDDLVDTPHLLPSRVPALLSTLSSTDNKLKKDLLMLKRELMDIGKEKDKQEL